MVDDVDHNVCREGSLAYMDTSTVVKVVLDLSSLAELPF